MLGPKRCHTRAPAPTIKGRDARTNAAASPAPSNMSMPMIPTTASTASTRGRRKLRIAFMGPAVRLRQAHIRGDAGSTIATHHYP